MCHSRESGNPGSLKTVFIRVNQRLRTEISHFEPVPLSLCGCLNLCESALSAIPFRFAHLNIRVLTLFRILVRHRSGGSCFVFRISSYLCLLLPLHTLYTCRDSSTNQAFFCKQSQCQNGQYKHKSSKNKGLCQQATNNEHQTPFRTKPIKPNLVAAEPRAKPDSPAPLLRRERIQNLGAKRISRSIGPASKIENPVSRIQHRVSSIKNPASLRKTNPMSKWVK